MFLVVVLVLLVVVVSLRVDGPADAIDHISYTVTRLNGDCGIYAVRKVKKKKINK